MRKNERKEIMETERERREQERVREERQGEEGK